MSERSVGYIINPVNKSMQRVWVDFIWKTNA